MASNAAGEQLFASRSEIISASYDGPNRRRACSPRIKTAQSLRSAAPRRAHSTTMRCCSHCKTPLSAKGNRSASSIRSRASTAFSPEPVCQDCCHEKSKSARSPSSRLFKSESVNWSHMGEKIETWFEKARTPDRQVVYNFLEELNTEPEKKIEKPVETARVESLNDVISGLKKYQARFPSLSARNRFSRTMESSSWRVLRHPETSYEFTSYDPMYGNDATRDMCLGSVFLPTKRRIRSTFLIHPNWV